jgi:hypothetical protein
MFGLLLLILFAWFWLQFRPARRRVWARRKADHIGPLAAWFWRDVAATCRALFVKPALRLWRRGEERKLRRTFGETIDETIDKILGREGPGPR